VFFLGDVDAEPCGRDSDCINRAIFIECLADECRARGQCRNQRWVMSPLSYSVILAILLLSLLLVLGLVPHRQG
jgi:hypothetical protein